MELWSVDGPAVLDDVIFLDESGLGDDGEVETKDGKLEVDADIGFDEFEGRRVGVDSRLSCEYVKIESSVGA